MIAMLTNIWVVVKTLLTCTWPVAVIGIVIAIWKKIFK